MRIIVTGASGNIGTALLRRLGEESQRLDVVGICRRPPAARPPYDSASWHELDLAEADAGERLGVLLAGADAVVHLAWLFQPSHDLDYLERANVAGTAALVRAAASAGVAHVVHLSSVGAYAPGPDGVRVGESWPVEGVPSLPYSRQKVAVERLLDAQEQAGGPTGMRIARLRPGVVVQRAAGSALLRYGLPAVFPASLVRRLPVLPLDRSLVVQLVHASDVADAIVRTLRAGATGAFNLVAEPVLTRDDIAAALGARPLHVPKAMVRGAAALAWRARVQPVDPGWLDLAYAVPTLDAGRAHRELGWVPSVDAHSALAEAVAGMADAAGTASPALRRRSVGRQLVQLVRQGPVSHRHLS